MTNKEARLLLQAVVDRLDVTGLCKWMSAGPDNCVCAKCQIERMPLGDLVREVNEIHEVTLNRVESLDPLITTPVKVTVIKKKSS